MINRGVTHYDFKVRYGDSKYVINELVYIFSEGITPILEASILDHRALFGGPCDPYSTAWKLEKGNSESNVKLNWIADRPLNVCKRGISELKNQPIPTSSVLRTAWSHKVCKMIVSKNEHVVYALEHHGIKKLSSEDEQLLKAYRLFYPAKAANMDFIKVLKEMKSENGLDWPLILMTLCASEEWQII